MATGISGVSKENSIEIVQFVCFKLANEEYGIDINCVQEVLRPQQITPMPQMPDFVLGVMNIRGIVVPVFDLRRKLHLAMKELDDYSRIILIQLNGVMGSYLVDEVLDNIKLDGSKIDPTPDVKMSIARDCVRGLGMVDKRIIVIIDHQTVDASILKDIQEKLVSKRG